MIKNPDFNVRVFLWDLSELKPFVAQHVQMFVQESVLHSGFFHSKTHVDRLSFNAVEVLWKTGSKRQEAFEVE